MTDYSDMSTYSKFDRALGAWEDRQLNDHLAKEEEWDFAHDQAEGAVWDMRLSELYKMSPVGVERKIEEVAERMIEHVAQLIVDGGDDGYDD